MFPSTKWITPLDQKSWMILKQLFKILISKPIGHPEGSTFGSFVSLVCTHMELLLAQHEDDLAIKPHIGIKGNLMSLCQSYKIVSSWLS